MKCLNCGKPVTGKAKTCSTKCRMALSRKRVTLPATVTDNSASVTRSVTDVTVTTPTVTEKTTVTQSVTTTDNGCNGVTVNGEFIPENELNIFYQGLEGKLRLGTDEVYVKHFKVDPILYRESERQAKLNKKVSHI